MVAVPSRGRADLQAHAPEADATRALYEQYARQIYAYCFSKLRTREEAEDAVQSTFLNAFRALQRDVAPAHEAAWLYKIAENVCLTRARSSVRRRRVETPGDLDAISDVVPAHEPETEELANLPQALESMPEQQRRALLLREWQGLSYREIADELDLSQSAVETLLFRARRTLAAGLAAEEPKRGKLARMRASGDAGAVISLLKTLLFSGGAKVVIAGAVAASGVVGVSPGARHTIDDLFVPHMTAAKPSVVHHAAPAKAKAKPAVTYTAPVAVAPVVVHHSAPRVTTGSWRKQVAVHHAKPRHAAKLHQPAPAVEERAATVAAATPIEPIQAAGRPQPAQSQGKAKGKDTPKHENKSSSRASQPTSGPPSGQEQAPADQPVEQPTQVTEQPGNNGNGNGHGYGRDKH